MTRSSWRNDLRFTSRTTDKITCKRLGQRSKISNRRDCLQTHCDTSWWIHCYFVINDKNLLDHFISYIVNVSEWKKAFLQFSFFTHLFFHFVLFSLEVSKSFDVTIKIFLSSSSSSLSSSLSLSSSSSSYGRARDCFVFQFSACNMQHGHIMDTSWTWQG